MKHNLLKSVIISVILLMGVSNAWAYVTYYLKSNNTTWSTSTYDWGFTHGTTTTTYMDNNGEFKLWRTDWGNDGWFGKGNNTTINLKENNHDGVQLQQWLDGGNVKYVGPSGMVCFHMDQDDGKEASPWVWITRPTFYLKHNWGGGSWTWKALTDNNDGTYTLTAKYGGTGANYGDDNTSQDGWGYITDNTPAGNPTTSNNCEFKFNSKDKSLTITRLYTITYNGNGHTGGTVPAAIDKKHGTNITLSSSTPTRTGYTFAGWNTKQNGTGTTYAKGATYSTNADVTLYAKWTANTYTVTFNKQSGTGGTNSVTATYNAAMPSATMPTRTGYTFNGYFDATSGGTKYYNANGTSARTWNKTASTTLYAQWTENKYNVVISTDGNGTTNQTGTKSIGIVGISITATPEIGSAFKQWEVTGGAKVADATNASTTLTATAAGTVTAIFEEKPATTIYLEPTGYWNSDNPQYVAHVWIKNNTSVNENIIMAGVGEAPYKYYKAEVPYGYNGVVFFRKKSDGSELWNQTADLTIPTDNKTLYEIKSTPTPSTGEWKEANLVYTITLGSSIFGPYGISYNGQSYFSKDDANVEISLPYGATINFIEGQPYSDIYTGGIMETGKVRQFDLTKPYTIKRDIKFDANYVTKVPQVAYLGVPNSLSGWAETDTRAQYIWRFDSQDGFYMEEVADRGTFAFEVDGVKYYKYTIQAGCNKFQFQHKTKSNTQYNSLQTHYHTDDHLYEVLTTDVNCYMLDGTSSGITYNGYWCALPPREGDYRLLYVEQVVEKDANGNTVITRKKAHPSDVVKASEIQEGVIVSLHTYNERRYQAIQIYDAGGNHTYYDSSNNPEIILQRYDGNNWIDKEWHMVYGPLETLPIMANLPGRKNASPGSEIDDLQYHDGIEIIKQDVVNHPDEGNGVWNFVIKQKDGGASGEATIDLERTHRYTGTYYIRTNAAFGEWNSYKGSDNHMTRSDVSKRNSNYSHYYCKWVEAVGTNVKFTIANDYGMAISDTLVADSTTLWGELLADDDKMVTGETLPASANVRFAWNEKSNFLHRAYLAGSTDVSSRFLVLEGKSDQLYNAEGQALTQGASGSERYGLNANEEIFNDISNWVYYTDVQMKPGAELKLTAKYNGKVQYFVGQAGDNYNNTILAGTGSQKYLIRLLYDFKTNELISAYVPGGNTNIEAIQTNLMLLRKENEPPRQLSFTNNYMQDVGQQAYGVLELTQATLEDNTQNVYVRSLYWISFPFDVRITDIFGFGEYGKHWLIQSYDGAKRAREGLWADSETNWVYHFDPNTLNADTPDDDDDGIMKKGVGYVVALNLKNIQADNLFKGRINTLALYFPSTTTITGHIVNANAVSISVPEHKCTINRPTPDGDRRIKDSHWNVIGVPSYINAVGDFTGKISTITEDVKFYYSWQGDYDKYKVVSGKSGVSFNSLNAYMVQFAGNLQWTNVLNEEAPAGMAAKRNSDNMQEHHLCLELQQNGNEQDRTFIQLQEDEVTTAFDFNYDLCKIINKGANIYSLIATDRDPIEVAGNVLPIEEAIIPLGIKTDAAGEYTFAMPEGTDGIVVELIDYETNTRTNMLLDEYTINLGKGTFETRFALHVRPDKTVTSLDNIGDETTGDQVKKFLIDGVLYMQKDGVLYDAQGKLVR